MVFEKVLRDIVVYLSVVHDIELDVDSDVLIEELEAYVQDLGDDILQDVWWRYVAESRNSVHQFKRHFNAFRANFRQAGMVMHPFYAAPKSTQLNSARRLAQEKVHLSWY